MDKTYICVFALISLLCHAAVGKADSIAVRNGCSVPVTVTGYVPHCTASYPGDRCSSPSPACGNFDPRTPDQPAYNPGWRCSAPVAECRCLVQAGGQCTGTGCTDCITRVEAVYRGTDGSQRQDEQEVSNLWACWFTGKYNVRIVQLDTAGPVCNID